MQCSCGNPATHMDQLACVLTCEECRKAALAASPDHPFQAIAARVLRAPDNIDGEGPPPSKAAGLDALHGMPRRVYNYVASRGVRGATVYEIVDALHAEHNTTSAALDEVKHLLRDTGGRRNTASGQPGIVWAAQKEKPQ